MIKLKKHSPLDKEKIIHALDIISKISTLGSEYYWLFEDYFKISDRHADRYDEVSEDITRLFVEGITYKDLYNAWGDSLKPTRRLPFFDKHPVHGYAFIVDAISGVIHEGSKGVPASVRYELLSELYNLSLYLMENPLVKDNSITQEVIDMSKTYVMKKEKSNKIKKVLLDALAPDEVIDKVLALL